MASSMPGGVSILMTLAPQSASWRTQVGPDRTRVRSSTVKRAKAFDARGKGIFWGACNAIERGRAVAVPAAVVYRFAQDGRSFRLPRSASMPQAIFPALSGGDHERRSP